MADWVVDTGAPQHTVPDEPAVLTALKTAIGRMHETRRAADTALKLALLRHGGQGAIVDQKVSGGQRKVYRCPSVMKTVIGKGKQKKKDKPGAAGKDRKTTMWRAEELPDFVCNQEASESHSKYKRRRKKELEIYAAQKGLCPFKVLPSTSPACNPASLASLVLLHPHPRPLRPAALHGAPTAGHPDPQEEPEGHGCRGWTALSL